ncbi:hypothetical protein MIND_00256000 [Mycena indigotica]|uniref:Uncharacterized protein n=1 Tax=Mycena indigotica TaxID=2126181 RepID=A0A8H6T5F8_9AGAR|nr:uncharacterized protein MIND_00256000 [Mycena indigotica]KAF7312425.1 hypothetical protein MIND_00256000 [Mycena indigotica]
MGSIDGLTAEQKANLSSMGYAHTYMDMDGLNLTLLMAWPSDAEMRLDSQNALTEATELLRLLGIDGHAMLAKHVEPTPPKPPIVISRPPQTLVALSYLSTTRRFLAALPDSTDASLDILRSDIQSHLATTMTSANNDFSESEAIPSINEALVLVVKQGSRTAFAARSIRRHGRLSTILSNPKSPINEDNKPSLRDRLKAKLDALAPGFLPANKTTGAGRQVRHTGMFHSQEGGARAANKETVKKVAASNFLRLRGQALQGHMYLHESVCNANITPYNPLKAGHFLIAFHPHCGGMVIGEVITMYEKSTMHDWVSHIDNAGKPSYLYIMTYTGLTAKQFWLALLHDMLHVEVPDHFANPPNPHRLLPCIVYQQHLTQYLS